MNLLGRLLSMQIRIRDYHLTARPLEGVRVRHNGIGKALPRVGFEDEIGPKGTSGKGKPKQSLVERGLVLIVVGPVAFGGGIQEVTMKQGRVDEILDGISRLGSIHLREQHFELTFRLLGNGGWIGRALWLGLVVVLGEKHECQ